MLAKSFRILVPCKRVIDYAVRIRVKADGTGVEKANVKHSMNPFDEIALEESLRIKQNLGPNIIKEIIAISCGPKQCQETLRNALSLGADRAIHVEHDDESRLQPLLVSQILEKFIKKTGDFGIVLLGKQAIDDDSNQTGQILAGLLNWPQITFASRVIVDHDQVTVSREVDSGTETITAKLPVVITTDLRLNEPRYSTLQNIMKAKSKPLEKYPLESFSIGDLDSKLTTLKTLEPPKRIPGVILESVEQLVVKIKTK